MPVFNTNRLCQPAEINHFDDYGVFARHSAGNEPGIRARLMRKIPRDERPLPFSRMIYLGDGDTDIPSMKMVRHQGGHSIGVFDPAKWTEEDTQRKVYNLISEDRARFVAPADYRPGSQLDVVVRGILGRIARAEGYRER
jgi:hypothetical protein